MSGKACGFILIACLCFSLLLTQSEASYAAEDLTPEKVIAEHVKSIGRPEYIAKLKSRSFVGTSDVKFIQGASGEMSGTSMMVSEGPKLAIVLKYGDVNYPGEYLAYDGKDVTVKQQFMSPGQKSPLADFLFRFNDIMKGGLIGGALSTAWPLLNMQDRQVDLKYRKTKVDGQELHEIEYHPKNGRGDLKIRIYFDLETFRHVRTEYRLRSREDRSFGNTENPLGTSKEEINRNTDVLMKDARPESIYVLIEKFGNFKKIGGLVLPHSYEMDYSLEGSGHAFIGDWKVKAGTFVFNKAYDEKFFKAEK
jgi:hypothetical protein